MRTIPKSLAKITSFTQTFLNKSIAVICLFMVVYTSTFAQILPSGSLGDWSNAGVQGGIPKYPNGVNVLDYGATGGGTVDDTDAIIAAIAACDNEEAVFLPAGTYLVQRTLNIDKPIVLRGEGLDSTHIIARHSNLGVLISSDRAGLEDLHFYTDWPEFDGNSGQKIQLYQTENSWVKGIEANGYCYWQINLIGTHHCEIRDSYIHSDPEDTLEILNTYGIMIIDGNASYNLVENNIFDWCAHNLLIQEFDGSDPSNNVFGYNFSWVTYRSGLTPPWSAATSMEFHNNSVLYNLVEGGMFDVGGFQSYGHHHNTFLRCRATQAGLFLGETNYAIGNELTEKKYPDFGGLNRIDPKAGGHIIHGNYIAGSGIQWDPTISDHNIPDSYYLSGRPEWFGDLDWPCYGGDLMPGNRRRSPAEVWYWSRMFPEETPSNLQGSNPGNDVVLTWNRESDPGREIDYIICKSRDNVHFYRIGETANTSFTDTEAENGHNYYYIRARNYLGGRNPLGELTIGDGLGGESDPTETIHVLVGGTPVDAASVTVTPASTTIEVGEDLQLAATVLPSDATNKLVSWSSDNISVATVNASGVVKGVSEGVATITVTTSDGGFTTTSSITVGGTILMEQTHLEKKDFSVFPNPAKDVLHFTFPDNQVKFVSIYNYAGQVVIVKKGTESSIDISELKAGVYFIMASGTNKNYYSKFIIK